MLKQSQAGIGAAPAVEDFPVQVAHREPTNRDLMMTLLAAFVGWLFDGVEMGLFPLVARPSLTEMMGAAASKDHIGTWISIIIALFLVGAAIGGIFFGWLGDRIGRVRAMTWSVLVYSIFSGLCCFSTHPWHMASLRFLASLGMGGEWSLGVALVMEVWPSKWRPMLAGLIGAACNVGFLLIALLGLVLVSFIGQVHSFLLSIGLPHNLTEALVRNSGWRLLLFLGALPAFLALFIRILVPESERWQHAAASAPPPRLADIFAGKLGKLTILATLLSAVSLVGTWGSVQWIPTWADKLAGPTARSAAQLWSGIGAVIGCVLGAYAAQWMNRRLAYFTFCLACLMTCAYLFRTPMHYGHYFLLWVCIVGGLTTCFYGWLPLYMPELFPTRVRATAQGFAYNAARVLAAVGVLESGRMVNAFGEDYARMCAFISLIYIVGMGLIWFCPETKGKPLPDDLVDAL